MDAFLSESKSLRSVCFTFFFLWLCCRVWYFMCTAEVIKGNWLFVYGFDWCLMLWSSEVYVDVLSIGCMVFGLL